jgi:SynChlorMet cassette radical SAM/SPASM protein ScmE
VRELEQIASLLLDDLGLPGFSVNAASYLGSCRQHADEVLLTTQQRQLAMTTLLQLEETYHGRISAMAGPLAEARQWSIMEEARTQGTLPFPSGGHLTGCGCLFEKFAVRADGVFVPCCMLAHMELGRINQDDLQEVWQHHAGLNRLRQRHTIPLTTFEFCRGCPYVPYCTGNCPGLASTLTGQINHPSPDACLRKFLEDGGQLPGIN